MRRVTMGHLRVTIGHPRVTVGHLRVTTVGVNKNWTLVIVNFSAQNALILKISVTIFKRRS